MKAKHQRLLVFISIIIILGFIITAMLNFQSYNRVIKDDIENIAKLSTTNIYSEINATLIKPIFVSLTMANDSFLKNWISNDELSDISKINAYLNGIKDKYHYDSVFLVSNNTKNYYHTSGILKEISPTDEHDVWYYKFLQKDKKYDLDVDTDQAHNDILTVFVNCKIYDADGNIMGVTGVGLKIDKVSHTMNAYNQNYDVEMYLIDPKGLVQIHADKAIIEQMNIFEDNSLLKYKDDILNDKDRLNINTVKTDGIDGFLISQYVEELDWYLIVKKDTTVIRQTFFNQLLQEFVVVSTVIVLVLLTVISMLRKYQNRINNLITKDSLTDSYNRREFNNQLKTYVNKNQTPFSLIIFDIDNFKVVNDHYGHLFGDEVILHVVEIAKKLINSQGILSRWGGDEFAAVVNLNKENTAQLAEELRLKISQHETLSKYHVTLSIGITEYVDGDSIDSIFLRADQALYQAKSEGKNKIFWS